MQIPSPVFQLGENEKTPMNFLTSRYSTLHYISFQLQYSPSIGMYSIFIGIESNIIPRILRADDNYIELPPAVKIMHLL